MPLAQNKTLQYNPIDLVEHIFANQKFELDRRNLNEVAVEVQGKWNNMVLFFAYEKNMNCMHLSCLMDIKTIIQDRSKVFELLALANEQLWMGHFSYWTEQNMPVFKHSIIINQEDENLTDKLSQIINIAIKECERMYPIFNVVLTKDMDPQRAMSPLMMETQGTA